MNRNVLFTGSILAVGLVYLAMALQMPRGSIAYPGPGFYPSAIGVFLVVCAAFCFCKAVIEARREQSAAAIPSHAEKGNTRATLQLLGLLVVYVAALPHIGFLLAIPVFLLLSMRVFGYRHWARSVLITAVIVAIAWAVFIYWLKVPLPRGFLGDYL